MVPEGTVKDAPLKVPVAVVLAAPLRVTLVEPNFAVNGEPEAKPVPDIVTVVVTGPLSEVGDVTLTVGEVDGAANASIAPTYGL